jgi:predicted flap endonuclease-1-like 5' DNA nuclease
MISGVGPKLADVLRAAGVETFAQIAKMSEKQAEAMDEQLNLQGRIVRESWIAQAKHLAAKS